MYTTTGNNLIEKIKSELREGMGLWKYRKCARLKESLENLYTI